MRPALAATAIAFTTLVAAPPAAQAQGSPATVKVLAAGSLKNALTQVGRDYEAAHPGQRVEFVFGPSGLLRDRLQAGEAADVFASANMAHPMSLAQSGRAEPVDRFARNALCALAAPNFQLHGKRLAERFTDPLVKLATSTPKADPSGDYAFEMFDRIEAQGQGPKGVAAALKARALQLTGGPDSPKPPADGRSLYGQLVAEGKADVFITYCTNAQDAKRERAALQVLPIPADINVPAAYGLAVLKPASAAARQFSAFLLGPQGQQALASYGFSAP